MPVKLTSMQRKAFALYFEQGLRHREVAVELRLPTEDAARKRINRIVDRYKRAGVTPPRRPGSGLRLVVPQSLSGVWDRGTREYLPTNN